MNTFTFVPAPMTYYSDTEDTFALCPECQTLILLVEWKDSESYSRSEYAEHYKSEHGVITLGGENKDA